VVQFCSIKTLRIRLWTFKSGTGSANVIVMKTTIERLIAKINDLALRVKKSKTETLWATIFGSGIVASFLVAVFIALIDRETAPDFRKFDAGVERKQAFISYFLPLIKQRNKELMVLREELQELNDEQSQLSFFERRQVAQLASTYAVENFSFEGPTDWNTLLRKIDVVPSSLALAQGANESAWGTSRFAREGNNFYGQWCFVEGCGVVPFAREKGANHEVESFDSAKESVEGYIHNLNYHPAYAELRSIRAGLREREESVTGLKVAAGLKSYSERGDAYIEELSSMIRFNGLEEHDVIINSTD
jgi:Bax protein